MNETEIINYVKDIDFEHNVKLLLLCLLTIYAVISWYYWSDRKPEMLYQWYIKKISLTISKVWFAVGGLWVFLLLRPVSFNVILRPILVLYMVAALVYGFSLFLGTGEKIKQFFTGEGFHRDKNENN